MRFQSSAMIFVRRVELVVIPEKTKKQNVPDKSIKSVTKFAHLSWITIILLYSIQTREGFMNFEKVQF